MNVKAFLNTISSTSRTLPLVILYVTEGCNLRCITCSYREALPGELSLKEILELGSQLSTLGLRHIVYSGGEPLLRKDFPEICEIFRGHAVKQTLLTNGLLLHKRFDEIHNLSEIIVSLDGATSETHNAIRGVDSFDIIAEGIRSAIQRSQRPKITIRTVLQKRNFREIAKMVELAHSLQVDGISFLAADIYSQGFGRAERGVAAENDLICLDKNETNEFRQLIGEMNQRFRPDFATRFIAESPDKLFHLAEYYDAILGLCSFPTNHCNAPMVSCVITSTGNVQPCFFLPQFGNMRQEPFPQLQNHPSIVQTRREVRRYSLERCHTCVCTLNIQPLHALADRF